WHQRDGLRSIPFLFHNGAMCYSAQLQAAYMRYLRETGCEMDIDQFVEIFGARVSDSSIRIPRAIERWFDAPKSDAERKIKEYIDEYRSAELTKLEREVFAQKKRLADAERTLAAKPTKAAAESQRIATNKIEQALTRIERLKAVKPDPAEARIFPLHFAPIVMQVGAKRLMRLARYHCRKPGEPAFMDRNGKNQVLHFVPRPAGTMMIACLYAEWRDAKDGTPLLSFAAITDEPPAEVAAAGHDRMIINLKPENLDAWLS